MKFVGAMRNIVLKRGDCFYHIVMSQQSLGKLEQYLFCSSGFDRASTMEDKYELFWRQGDFGYVKDVADTLMTLCEAIEKVS